MSRSTTVLISILNCFVAITVADNNYYSNYRSVLNLRIVGGSKIDIKDAPYQVYVSASSYCGGILISKNWILTAGHCTQTNTPSAYRARIGVTDLMPHDGLNVSVVEVHRHPKFIKTGGWVDYDFSLLKIDNNYDIASITASFASLPEQDEVISDGTLLRVSGYGSTNDLSDYRLTLRAVYVEKINDNICNFTYQGFITVRMVCAGFMDGYKDSCGGDSGGPLVWGNKAVGVVSWGTGCALPNKPGVYAKISYVRDWIREVSGV